MAELRYLTGYPPHLIEQGAALRDQGVVVECDHYTTDAQKYAYNGSDCRDPGAGTLEKVEAPKYRR